MNTPISLEMGNSYRTNHPTVQDSIANHDQEIVQEVEYLLENIAFKGTIQQIRALVNDPKWDDKR